MRCAPFLPTLLVALPLVAVGGCAPGVAVFTPADIVTVPVLGRGLADIGASATTGRDCSIVRLDAGKTYCAPFAEQPRSQPVCTRTIGVVNCWADPRLVPQRQQDVAQAPAPTADQLRYQALPWPKALFF